MCRRLADGADRGVDDSRRAEAQHVDAPRGRSCQRKAEACGVDHGHHIALPGAVADDCVCVCYSVVGGCAASHDEASAAYGVEFEVAGVGCGVVQQGHGGCAAGREHQGAAALVGVGPYRGAAVGHPSHGHGAVALEAFAVGRHYGMCEGAEAEVVACRRCVAARRPHVQVDGAVARQAGERQWTLCRREACPCSEGETCRAVFYQHRCTVGKQQGVPCQRGLALGDVVYTLTAEQAACQAQLVHRHRAAAHGQQGGVGGDAHVVVQRQHNGL